MSDEVAVLRAQLDRLQLQVCDLLDLVRASTAEQERAERHHGVLCLVLKELMRGN